MHCGRTDQEGYGNAIDCLPAPGVKLELERLETSRRGTLTTSACGVCGRRTVDDLFEAAGAVPDGPVISRSVVAGSTEALRQVQRVFELTGGTHAAAALDADGEILAGF
jgi:FdhD protein